PRSVHMSRVAFLKPAPISAWCRGCQQQVALANLRPWPEGVLAIGECPKCRAKLAAKKPIEWSGAYGDGDRPTAA
ncbi:MAG: hypothetical protein ABL963_11040, partial [Longimicrobiales bacterium]